MSDTLRLLVKRIFDRLVYDRLLCWIPDRPYLKLYYYLFTGKRLRLERPETYNEKLQWLKLYDRKALYTKLVDKYEAKRYVSSILGEEHLIPVLGVWDTFQEIDFSSLPDRFVLKCTHDSGSYVVCRDKTTFDYAAAKKKLGKALRRNYYWFGREWPYKNVKPRIIAEQYMEDGKTGELRDYKFYVFNGTVRMALVVSNRLNTACEASYDLFDAAYHRLDFTWGHRLSDKVPEKPEHFDEMLRMAQRLGRDLCHVRVDFYEADGVVYFGEFTFYPDSGFTAFDPPEWDSVIGSWLTLPGGSD